MPHTCREGESLQVGIADRVRVFPAGEPIVLTEVELEAIAFTMHIVAAEMADMTSKRLTLERAAQKEGIAPDYSSLKPSPVNLNVKTVLLPQKPATETQPPFA